MSHRADATAKYGKRARRCRAAQLPQSSDPPLDLNVTSFAGGIGLWGAVPAVYDTTRLPLDRGIHVHARRSADDPKEIDATFSAVRLVGGKLPPEGLVIDGIDAIYYMVSSVFGFPVRQVLCSHCGAPHLDKDWFSVHPHRRHLCAACGKTFTDTAAGVGNPIAGIRAAFGARPRRTKKAKGPLSLRQSDYPGGLQVWGSNQALIWTGEKDEEAGIHAHAFREPKTEPDIDDTFTTVTIDGVSLNPTAVRTLMAQNSMPHLAGRVSSLSCSDCGAQLFDKHEAAYTPAPLHLCVRCGAVEPSRGRLRKTIANPLVSILETLAVAAPRPPQQTRLPELLPETP